MFCPSCGKQLTQGAQFCGFCGGAAAAAPQPGGFPVPEGFTKDPNNGLYYSSMMGSDPVTGAPAQLITWFDPGTGEKKEYSYPVEIPQQPVMQQYAPQPVQQPAAVQAPPVPAPPYAPQPAVQVMPEPMPYMPQGVKRKRSPLPAILISAGVLVAAAVTVFFLFFFNKDAEGDGPGGTGAGILDNSFRLMPIDKDGNNLLGNLPQNLGCLGGLFGSQRGWIFYSDPDDGFSLHMYNPETDENIPITDFPVANINILGDRLVFTNLIGTIYRSVWQIGDDEIYVHAALYDYSDTDPEWFGYLMDEEIELIFGGQLFVVDGILDVMDGKADASDLDVTAFDEDTSYQNVILTEDGIFAHALTDDGNGQVFIDIENETREWIGSRQGEKFWEQIETFDYRVIVSYVELETSDDYYDEHTTGFLTALPDITIIDKNSGSVVFVLEAGGFRVAVSGDSLFYRSRDGNLYCFNMRTKAHVSISDAPIDGSLFSFKLEADGSVLYNDDADKSNRLAVLQEDGTWEIKIPAVQVSLYKDDYTVIDGVAPADDDEEIEKVTIRQGKLQRRRYHRDPVKASDDETETVTTDMEEPDPDKETGRIQNRSSRIRRVKPVDPPAPIFEQGQGQGQQSRPDPSAAPSGGPTPPGGTPGLPTPSGGETPGLPSPDPSPSVSPSAGDQPPPGYTGQPETITWSDPIWFTDIWIHEIYPEPYTPPSIPRVDSYEFGPAASMYVYLCATMNVPYSQFALKNYVSSAEYAELMALRDEVFNTDSLLGELGFSTQTERESGIRLLDAIIGTLEKTTIHTISSQKGSGSSSATVTVVSEAIDFGQVMEDLMMWAMFMDDAEMRKLQGMGEDAATLYIVDKVADMIKTAKRFKVTTAIEMRYSDGEGWYPVDETKFMEIFMINLDDFDMF